MGKDIDDDDDWTNYSSAQYGVGDNSWSEESENKDKVDLDDLDFMEENFEVTPAPSKSGQTHLVRLGCCNHCLGRVGGVSLLNKTLFEAGKEIREAVLKSEPQLNEKEIEVCPMCEDLFEDIELITSRLSSSLSDYEFSRLQLGFQLPSDLIQSEEHIRISFGANRSHALKQSLSLEISTKIKMLIENIEIVNENPEILALVDCLTLSVKIECRSLYLYTRYCKFERGLPQTHWSCRTCKGRGCEKCDNTGLQYPQSVQSLIADPLLEIFSAESHSTHSMGREDIDVRCLGNGRPTVIELKNPKKRIADLDKLTKLVNKSASGKVEIKKLRNSNKSEVVRVKDAAADKSYHICFKLINEVDDDGNEIKNDLSDEEIIEKISQLSGVELNQRTPKRVSHRRADKIRKRKVIELYDVEVNNELVEFKLRAQSGTYIKEMVTSDSGRTVPSVAELLNLKCEVEWLDVLDIHSD
ncbi:MAG: tRNA pseudouridine(54/55) synthase Pus10 [Euryarchaeota archaeon]|nr:tRNA pseudouridine(54/55) synthase Pus10 [Euryarchaeota archaeon]